MQIVFRVFGHNINNAGAGLPVFGVIAAAQYLYFFDTLLIHRKKYLVKLGIGRGVTVHHYIDFFAAALPDGDRPFNGAAAHAGLHGNQIFHPFSKGNFFSFFFSDRGFGGRNIGTHQVPFGFNQNFFAFHNTLFKGKIHGNRTVNHHFHIIGHRCFITDHNRFDRISSGRHAQNNINPVQIGCRAERHAFNHHIYTGKRFTAAGIGYNTPYLSRGGGIQP